jgi:dihydropyrimidinase
MAPYDLVIRGGTIVTPAGTFAGDIGIAGEHIAAIGANLSGREVLPAEGLLVIPGAIDGHVHLGLKLPRFTTVDDFDTGTRAAAIGGVTTIIDFATPDSGVALSEALVARQHEADGRVNIDYGLHVCVTDWRHGIADEIAELPGLGVSSIKLFMNYRERGWMADDAALYEALSLSVRTGLRVMVHAENDFIIELLQRQLAEAGRDRVLGAKAHIATRPPVTEWEAIERAITWARATGGHLYVVHISTMLGAQLVRRARADGVDVIGETCPHYLLLTSDLLQRPDGHLYACCPPLRPELERVGLGTELAHGGIQVIGTDTCSFTRAQKDSWDGDYRAMAFGLPGVDTLVPLTYQWCVATGRMSVEQWVDLIAHAPAHVHGLYPKKGALVPGADADIVLFNPQRTVTISRELLPTCADYTQYDGVVCRGWPVATLLRGQLIAFDGAYVGAANQGRYVKRRTINGAATP